VPALPPQCKLYFSTRIAWLRASRQTHPALPALSRRKIHGNQTGREVGRQTLPTRCGLLHGSTQNVEEPALFLDLTTDGRYIADSLLLRAADCTMTAPERERAKMRKSTVFEFITGIVNVGDTMRR
jgi:hypothetical protein